MKFKIGDKVWTVGMIYQTKLLPCPDCMGDKCVTVILGDGSKVSVDCACGRGYEGPKGYIEIGISRIESTQHIVTGMDIDGNNVEYKLDGYGGSYKTAKEDRIFATKEEADLKLKDIHSDNEKEEHSRLMWQKEDNRRTWAWNAHYHRDCLKRAQRDIAYHSMKLSVAKANQKEDKRLKI